MPALLQAQCTHTRDIFIFPLSASFRIKLLACPHQMLARVENQSVLVS